MNKFTKLNQSEIEQVAGGGRSYPSVACFLIIRESKKVLGRIYYPNIYTQGEYRKARYIPENFYELEDGDPSSEFVCIDNVNDGDWDVAGFMDKYIFNSNNKMSSI